MAMSTLTPFPSGIDSLKLDALIAKMKLRNGPDDDVQLLLIEHLQSAHTCLQGAMPAECALSLALALRTVRDLSDSKLRREAKELIAGLLEHLKQSMYRQT
jgi:hypothetical protein